MDEKELSAAFGGQFFNGLFKPVDYPLGAVAPPIDHVPRWHVLKLGMVERYVEGHAELHCTVHTAVGRNYRLSFRAVPLKEVHRDQSLVILPINSIIENGIGGAQPSVSATPCLCGPVTF